jgi:hypothetical protein
MATPKIQHPTFAVTVPSNKNKKIRMRPYTVKEEKILIAAQSSDDPDDMVEAVKQVLSNCIIEDINLDKVPLFDIEYFFVKMRAMSVNNIVELEFTDKNDGNRKHDIEVDLNDVEVRFLPDHNNKLDFGNGVGALLKYPDFQTMTKVKNNILKLASDPKADRKETVDAMFQVYSTSIEKLYDDDKVYVYGEDFDDAEAIEFLEQLGPDAIKQFQTFFETMPTVYYEIKYKTSGGEEKTIPLSGLSDFFSY